MTFPTGTSLLRVTTFTLKPAPSSVARASSSGMPTTLGTWASSRGTYSRTSVSFATRWPGFGLVSYTLPCGLPGAVFITMLTLRPRASSSAFASSGVLPMMSVGIETSSRPLERMTVTVSPSETSVSAAGSVRITEFFGTSSWYSAGP